VIRIRESFGAKLLSALLGTVGFLLIVTVLVVRYVTEQQVDSVATRTAQNAERLFEARDDVRREAVSVLARSFLETPRALQRLRLALQDNDLEYLAGDLLYEMDLQGVDDALFVFTDETGRPALTVVRGQAIFDADPADIQPLAEQLLFGDSLEARGYRVVDGTMYGVQASYLEFRGRPIGSAALGVPIGPADVQEVSEVGGFEGCSAPCSRPSISTSLCESTREGWSGPSAPSPSSRAARRRDIAWLPSRSTPCWHPSPRFSRPSSSPAWGRSCSP
jgi:hypothetical protein